MDHQALEHHLSYALDFQVAFQACLAVLPQASLDHHQVLMPHNHHQDWQGEPWRHWVLVLLDLVVLNLDLGFLVHHLLWEAAKESPWILKKGMRAGGRKNEIQENEEVVGRAAEITIGGMKRTEAEGGMEMIVEAEEEEEEVEVEMMTVVEDGMVVIETVAIGTETEEVETAGAPQEEVEVEIWPRDFKAWLGLMEMEGGEEEEETKAQEWELVDLMA